MNRRSRHLVVLTVAVVTAAIASFAVYRAMLQIPADAAERAPQFVVVARALDGHRHRAHRARRQAGGVARGQPRARRDQRHEERRRIAAS